MNLGRDGGREGRKEGVRERWRERGKEGGSEGGRYGGREGGREGSKIFIWHRFLPSRSCFLVHVILSYGVPEAGVHDNL